MDYMWSITRSTEEEMKTSEQILAGMLAASLMLTSSCATQTLWEEANPHEGVWVSASEVTEQQLIDKKIPYYKSNDELGDGYLIPKGRARQLGDYTIRIFATPITVVIDAATTVVVIGATLCTEGGGYGGTYP
jgi:hypothetical protein